jgi:two-component system nitrate/nitrite response regulator NarL
VTDSMSRMSCPSLIPDLPRGDLPTLDRSPRGATRANEREGSGSRTTVRVMVLADVRLYREGLAHLLAAEPRLTVVAAEPVTADSLLRARAEQTDVILLEATTACETRVIEELALLAPEAKVVAYGILDEDRQALRCAEAGAAAFVTGEATAEQLVSAILGVARGEVNCSPRLAALLIKRLRSLAQHMAPVGTDARLTPRERGIAALIDEGLSNKEIAARLGIEVCTVQNHVHHILEKLEVTRRSAARLRHSRLIRSTVQGFSRSGS